MRYKCFLNEDDQVLWTEVLLGVDAVAGDPTWRATQGWRIKKRFPGPPC
jgi:hypothetical protein